MSSFAQQPRARQQQRQRSRSPASCSTRSSSPARSVDESAILLFAPARPTLSPSQSWAVLASASHSHSRALSPASTSASSSASPVTLTRSLFPSHGGDGIFAADSLLLSEQSDASYASPSEQSTSASSTRSRPRAARTRTRTRSPHAAGDLGGSWALTEEALSALPDADTPVALGRRHRPASAVDTSSDSSARDDDDDDDDEDLLSSTPHAASAGLGSSRWRKVRQAHQRDHESSAGPYPSPPPMSLARRQKRRHRQEGRGNGSQKRSSASGSAPASVAGPAPPIPATTRTPPPLGIATTRRESAAFFGKLVSKLVDVDSETLDMFHAAATLATPPSSRSSSPTTSPTPHGVHALAHHARSELGFSFSRDIDMGGLSDDSGDETETERAPRYYHRLLPVVVDQPRSHSLTSLPSYFMSPLSPSYDSTLLVKDAAPQLIRRTSSFSGAVIAATTATDEGNAWGGEFEGFEAALSYWRRILRRMRGV